MQNVINSAHNSPLLNALEQNTINPFQYSVPKGVTYGLKNTQVIYPKGAGSDTHVYGRRIVFEVPKNGFLAQVFIESTLSSTGDNTALEDRLGSRVFSEINLQTVRGPREIQKLTPLYTNSRMDQLDTNLSVYVESSVEPNQTFNNNTITCFSPCFFSFSERSQQFLDTNLLEPFQVECIINNDKESMGLVADIDTSTFKMHCIFYTLFDYEAVPRSFTMLSYDAFYEPVKAVTAGDTSATIKITCPSTVFNMHMALVSTTQEYHRINNFELRVDNKVVTERNRRINYSFYSYEQSESLTGTYCYWFSMAKNRISNTLSLPLNNMGATELKVFFDSVPAGFSLYVFFEHWAMVEFDESGLLDRYINY